MQYKKSVFRSLAMVTQLGLSVMTPIFLCIFAGYLVDSHFGTRTMVVFLIVGVLAGGRCAYVLAMAALKADERERRQEEGDRRPEDGPEVHKPKRPSRIFGDEDVGGEGQDEEGRR